MTTTANRIYTGSKTNQYALFTATEAGLLFDQFAVIDDFGTIVAIES